MNTRKTTLVGMLRGFKAHAMTALLLVAALNHSFSADQDASTQRMDGQKGSSSILTDGAGGYTFDTGVIRGRLHPGGKALGLTEVVHVPSGLSLSGPYGLLSLYRVFSGNHRYGTAAWAWPSTSRLQGDGSVEIHWAAEEERPFELRTIYRWPDPSTVELEIRVTPRQALPAFEIFLASYFDGAFADPSVYVAGHPATENRPGLLLARREFGDWQMFPRDKEAIPTILDGRWRIEPHPVEWTIQPRLAAPLAVRRAETLGLLSVLSAPVSDCFAISTPYAGETHYSIYLSLFGNDLTVGQEQTVKARLTVCPALSDADIIERYGRRP